MKIGDTVIWKNLTPGVYRIVKQRVGQSEAVVQPRVTEQHGVIERISASRGVQVRLSNSDGSQTWRWAKPYQLTVIEETQ